MIKHVVAFDVSMGKSMMVIYNQQRKCILEKELKHSRLSFKYLHQLLQELLQDDGLAPEIVFEATGVYSKPLENFFVTLDIAIAVSTLWRQIYKWHPCVAKR